MTATNNLRTFFILWWGIFLSTLGTQMTNFAVTLWAWELTGKATPLALLAFFTMAPRIIAAIFAGVIVDRCDRQMLMILGDGVAALSTLVLLGLAFTDHLQIWHLYLTAAVNGLFSYFQNLAFSTSIALIVPKRYYARATVMEDYLTYSSAEILAPAIAIFFYYRIGLKGILIIDLVTFLLGVGTVLLVKIPQPQKFPSVQPDNLAKRLTYGFYYIWHRPTLLLMLLFLCLANFFSSIAWAIFPTFILARTNNNAAVLATVQAAIGIGGVTGGVILSFWEGFKPRIHGLLLGNALSELSSAVLGVGQTTGIWVFSGFLTAFFAPLVGSSNQAIWLSKVEAEIQGRVFASRYLMAQLMSPLAYALAGPLADGFFEPGMHSDGILVGIAGKIWGTGEGAGMGVQLTLFSLANVFISLGAYSIPLLRHGESILPDAEGH